MGSFLFTEEKPRRGEAASLTVGDFEPRLSGSPAGALTHCIALLRPLGGPERGGRLGWGFDGRLGSDAPSCWPAGSVQGLRGHLPFCHHDQLQLVVGRSCLPDVPLGLHVAQHEASLLVAGARWLG